MGVEFVVIVDTGLSHSTRLPRQADAEPASPGNIAEADADIDMDMQSTDASVRAEESDAQEDVSDAPPPAVDGDLTHSSGDADSSIAAASGPSAVSDGIAASASGAGAGGAGAGSGSGSAADAGERNSGAVAAGDDPTGGGSASAEVPAVDVDDLEGVDVTGRKELEVVMKRSKKAMLKQWAPKILRLDGRVLSVFRTAKDKTPKDSVVVRDGCTVRPWFDSTRPFGMEFRSPARTWLFVMRKAHERDEWIREIRARAAAPRVGTCTHCAVC